MTNLSDLQTLRQLKDERRLALDKAYAISQLIQTARMMSKELAATGFVSTEHSNALIGELLDVALTQHQQWQDINGPLDFYDKEIERLEMAEKFREMSRVASGVTYGALLKEEDFDNPSPCEKFQVDEKETDPF